ncbi:MAG: toll/interleukin-1 receptor domain-containing protein [Acidimicrobiia bacterium]|nr:toll/interleukin-1 receptor domain-containing protein [Acidimicrobiia bacterium]
MARDVFICHATEDRAAANALVAGLEAERISCWIAPRNIMPGADYAQAIVAALAEARVLVLVVSGHANTSPHVGREVERAAAHGLRIIPYRVEAVEPSGSLAYFLGSAEWFDATSGDPAGSAVQMAQAIRRSIGPEPATNPREATRQILHELLDRFGTGLTDDPRRLQALLRDVAGEHRAEVAVLVAAAEEGVGATLLQSSEGLTPQAGERLVLRLQQNRALAEDAARWAVDSWAFALGLAGPAAETPAPSGAVGETVGVPAEPDTTGKTVAVPPAETRPVEPSSPLPETVGMEGQGPPSTPPPPPPVSLPPTRPERRRPAMAFIGAAAVAVLLIGGVAAWMATRNGSSVGAFSANEVFLEPAGVVEDRFTASLLSTATNPPPGPPTTLTAPAPIQIVLVEGSHELSYAADRGQSACDAGILETELSAAPTTAAAWAAAQGIDVGAVGDFIAQLTPMFLTQDTRVTSHVLVGDQAVPRQALLQEGTAVLVGPTGEPRVRCASGSPLALPVAAATPTYVGTAWSDFDPERAVEIKPCDEPITEFVVQDTTTGEPFVRQVGANVSGDSSVTTTTILPSTTTTVPPTTTTSTTTTTTTTLPVADYDATREGTVSASSLLCGSYGATKATDGSVTTSWISGRGDVESSTFVWTGDQDEFIGSVSIISNAAHSRTSYRTNHGFESVTVQVIDAAGTVVYEEDVELPGTPDPDVLVYPNVIGRSVSLLLMGPETPSASGFAEFNVWVAR